MKIRLCGSWNLHTGNETGHWKRPRIFSAWQSPTGSIVTGGRDGKVRVWDQKGNLTADLGSADDSVLKVAFTADGKSVVSADWAGAVRVWPVAGGTPTKLVLPLVPKAKVIKEVAVPVPSFPVALIRTLPAVPPRNISVTTVDLDRKCAALKSIEDAVEKLKDEAARNPKNNALAKAYLQLCEAALAMKAEVIEAESAPSTKTQEKP